MVFLITQELEFELQWFQRLTMERNVFFKRFIRLQKSMPRKNLVCL